MFLRGILIGSHSTPSGRLLLSLRLFCKKTSLLSLQNTLRHLASLPCNIESIASFLSGLSKDTLVLSTSLFFLDPTSRDLRSHRLGYHYRIAYVGLKSISLDAVSITLRDSPLVNGSTRFFSVWI
jgi:hypothetical protein